MKEYVWVSCKQFDELCKAYKSDPKQCTRIFLDALKISETSQDEDKAFYDYVQQKIDERKHE